MPRRPPCRRGGGFWISSDQIAALRSHLNQIVSLSAGINSETRVISEALTGVENRTSIWARILWWAAVAAAIGVPLIALIVLGYKTGAFSFFRSLFGLIGSLGPTPANREADEDARMIERGQLDPDAPAVVARRQRSETYRKRVERTRRNIRAKETPS